MKILGVAGLNHDPSVALLDNGRIRFAIESEKVTRQKHEISFCPERAIQFALRSTGVDLADIDYFAANWKPGPLANAFYLPHIWKFVRRNCYPWYLLPTFAVISGSHHPAAFLRMQEDEIPPIVEVRHHLAHLGSCYTLSPFSEAAVAIIDGAGEIECTSLYHCCERRVRKLYSMDLPLDSLGHVYTMATTHLGYRLLSDEYKVMGLAAYGQPSPKFTEFFRELIQLLPEGRYRVDRRLTGNFMKNGYRFPLSIRSRLGSPRDPDAPIRPEHEDFARALQLRLEEAMLHVVRHLRGVTGSRHLCLAGGVVLNAVANGRILEEGGFDRVFIQPAAHDAGTSLGAAAYLHYHVLKRDRPEPMPSAYLGPAYDDAHIESDLQRVRVPYQRVDDPAASAARLVANGNVVGWFQGAAEFGPRALGARSILADPRDATMKERVNRLVKERENYRPFAPSLLEQAMSDYFEFLTEAPYMVVVGKVRPEKRAEIPAVVHVDGTARPQSVSRITNPRFYALIEAFREFTGVPVVLNTSFNVAGEPIVLQPSDAIRCFYGSGLDALVIGSFLLEKQQHCAGPS